LTYTAEQYIDDVLSGKELVCKWVRLAVERHVNDLKRQNTKNFPYHFDAEAPKKVIRFIKKFCHHVKGEFANRRETVVLSPWQQFIVWVVFGWKRKNGKRKYNTVFIEVGKKNGKSTFVAAIGLYMLIADGEEGPEIYSAATVRDQAKIVFYEYARAMVTKSEDLEKYIQVYQNILTFEKKNGKFCPVSSEADNLDGKHVHCAIIDEYHAHKTDEVYIVLGQGMSGRAQGIEIIITTAGFDPYVPCVDEEEYAKSLLSGEQENEDYFAIIFTLDDDEKGEKWRDKNLWIKANPELGRGKPWQGIERDFKLAEGKPQEVNKFKNKHLNIWTSSQTGWLSDDVWKKVCIPFDMEQMEGAPCYAGIDLSTTVDASAYALCFPWENKFRLYLRIFLPDYDILERIKTEKVHWDQWAKNGHVILTPGNKIDYDFIQAKLEEDAERFDLQAIAYDPYNSSQFVVNLIKAGFEDILQEFPQSWKYINAATKDFEIKVLGEALEVYPNPCMDWMVGSTEVRTDANGNYRPVKPDKRKSKKHIDGVFAGLMAVSTAVRDTEGESVYETEGVIIV